MENISQRSNSMGILEQTKENIIRRLKDAGVSLIILVGDTGMGKTWIVREISEHPIGEVSFYETLWVYMTEKYDINLFYKDIAKQYLSLGSITEEWEDKEENEQNKTLNSKKVEVVKWGHREEKVDQQEEEIEDLKRGIQEKMKNIGQTLSMENKWLLLVLDDQGDNLISDDQLHTSLLKEWISMFPSKVRNRLKIIITARSLGGHNAAQTSEVIRLPPHLEQGDTLTLLQNGVDKKVSENPSFRQLEQAIVEKSDGKPAAIIVIAKALNYIARHDDSKLGTAILKAAHYERTFEGVNSLFYCAFDMIENNVTKNCFWHSIRLFCHYGGVHYNELIAHWIMEGYFDPFDHIEKAYWEGFDVLMELIDRAVLKIQENNIVAVEGEALDLINSCPPGFNDHTAALSLFSAFNKDESLGRVTRMDGMIKTLCNPKFWEKNSTLLIDDSHLSQEVHETFFNFMKELRVLAVFGGRCESLISSKMDKLLVLVLRRCDLQDDLAHIKRLKALKVLEISGDESNSMLSIPDNLLDEMTQLESLNLSGLSMKSLPKFPKRRGSLAIFYDVPSSSKESELRVLILRQLTRLEEAQSLKNLVKLEILDFSGASSLKSLPNNVFAILRKLRVLILSKCSGLEKLQSLQGLGELRVLDISDATSFESFDDSTLSVIPKIQKIDLSNTRIQSLPEFHELKHLKQMLLRGCRNLRSLPKLQLVTSLQILDLKDAVEFNTFTDESIAHLDQLRILDLSGTSISRLPPVHPNLLELNVENT